MSGEYEQPRAPAGACQPPRFRIGEIAVRLHCDEIKVREDFCSLYERFRTDEPATPGEIEVRVVRDRRTWYGRRRYLVLGDGERISTVRRHEELMPYVEWAINARVIARRAEFLQLHAATLAHEGSGFIFAAASGSGKSTLAAGLMARGWKYYSDEFALIQPGALALHAFPKALCIKEGAFDAIGALGLSLWRRRFFVKVYKGRVGYLRPHDVAPSDPIGSPARVRYIFLPRHVDGGRPRIIPISRAQAAFALAGSALNPGAFGRRLTSVIAEVVRSAECYRLDAGPLEETCQLVESVLPDRLRSECAVRVA
jgi:HprK-related kinase A